MNFMKQWALALSLALVLTACGTPAEEPPQEEPSQAEDPGDAVVVLPTADPEARAAFGSVLWDAYLTGILPDGTPLDWTGPEGAAGNSFALCDVDGDGQEELLLFWTNASMAGSRFDVFGYRDGAVFTELTTTPFVTFYGNGVVTEEWSHNQGLAGNTDFWPYDLHSYDAETGIYQNVGAADAWSSEQPAAAEEFPADIDADGDGMVYFLLPANWDGSYSSGYLADGPEYEAWRAGYLDGAQPLDLQTQPLTEDNIAALGCPKPDVVIPEPVG